MARTGPDKLAVFARGLDGAPTPPLAEFSGALDSAAGRPFWSPDSSAVGFCDGAKLRIAELAGAALRTLGDCERTYRSGDWGDDGTIVYAPSSNSGILAVPAAGGAVTPATPFDDKVPDFSHRFPRFLPGGRRFLYLAWSNAADAPEEAVGLFVGDLDSGKVRRLSDARSNVALVGDASRSRLLFRQERGLVALDFDPGKLVLGGGEVTVEPDLQWWAPGGYASFSANLRGDVLSLPPQGQQAYILNIVDRQGTDRRQINLPAIYSEYAVSPDGKRLAAAILDPLRGVEDIWVIDLEREVSTRLTQARGDLGGPVWFPDGRTIGFSNEEVTGLYQPFAVAADGSSPVRRLAETPGRDTLTAISPDTQWLLVTREAGPRNEIWAHSLRDSLEVAICRNASGDCENGTFSPDGRFVAFSSDYSGRPEIYVRPFLAEGSQLQLSSAGGNHPHWRADGDEIVFRDPEGWDVAAEISTVPRLEAKPARRLRLSGANAAVAPFPDHSLFFSTAFGAGGAAEARVILGWR
jgi:dipeptidyl aminopeptidase/acylaminoacyl peptidase